VDAPALGDPARIGDWLNSLSVAGRLGLNGRVNTQVLLGQEVLISGHRGEWSRVEVPEQRGSKYPNGIIGWVPSDQLSSAPPAKGDGEAIIGVPSTWLYTVIRGRVGPRRYTVSYDTELPVEGTAPGYLLLGLPGRQEGAVADSALDPVPVGTLSGAAIASQAKQFLELPYLWAGTSGFGYDCSGLVYALYARFGLYLPRDAADQQHAGTPVPLDELAPGDLLFFAGSGGRGPAEHVAIYVGGGRMIDAPYTGKRVELVPMTSLPVWPDFVGATRIATRA